MTTPGELSLEDIDKIFAAQAVVSLNDSGVRVKTVELDDDQIDALKALACRGLDSGWRPISSAPKDREVLAWDGKSVGVGSWDHNEEEWFKIDVPENPPITHWMPLPAPPADGNDSTPLRLAEEVAPTPALEREERTYKLGEFSIENLHENLTLPTPEQVAKWRAEEEE